MARELKALDYSVLQQCMHCGMCLPHCPTYRTTKIERHSPRGRIALMRAVADGGIEVSGGLGEEMDYCLGCLACQSACPAGVDYVEMFETARAESERGREGKLRKLLRWGIFKQVFLFPRRLRAVGRLLRFYQRSGLAEFAREAGLTKLLGERMAELEAQAPEMEEEFSDERIAEVEKPRPGVEVRGRVGFLSGCVQSLAFASVNRATVDVLLANGWEVVTPRAQVCCGSLHAHNGHPEWAAEAARKLMGQFEVSGLEAIISNAGGCGGHLKRYAHLLPDEPRAAEWDAKVKDIHEFLSATGFRRPLVGTAEVRRVTYHASCHLCHGQGVVNQPVEILKAIPGLEFVELEGATECCGSAGIYNVLQPEESARQLERKVAKLERTGAACVAMSNPGCHLQVQRGLDEAGVPMAVTQPVVLLAEAYRREG